LNGFVAGAIVDLLESQFDFGQKPSTQTSFKIRGKNLINVPICNRVMYLIGEHKDQHFEAVHNENSLSCVEKEIIFKMLHIKLKSIILSSFPYNIRSLPFLKRTEEVIGILSIHFYFSKTFARC